MYVLMGPADSSAHTGITYDVVFWWPCGVYAAHLPAPQPNRVILRLLP
jgi:hypothetical protein